MIEKRYTIPAGTSVEFRNTATDDKVRPYITKKELRFADRAGTGYGGAIFYFKYSTWIIAVNADRVK